uniref:Myb-like domain-containing protein n=1 Tax=Kalanchoe fedtschenkoi TaxID=63787 RepID=A0A7N0VFN1_KALFE
MGSKKKSEDGAGIEGYVDNLLKDNDIDKREKKKTRKKSAKNDLEGAVDEEVSNHSKQDGTTSFAKDDEGKKKLKKKDSVKSTKLEREGAVDGAVNSHLREDGMTSIAKDDKKKKKKKKDERDEKAAQIVLGGIGNDYQSNLSYGNIETMTEKDSGKEIKMKKRKIKSTNADSERFVAEDSCEGSEKKTPGRADGTVDETDASKKSKKRKKNNEAAVSIENSDSKGKSVSFADHVKDNVKSGRNHLGVTSDDVQSNRVFANIGTAAEKDSDSENKVKKTKKKKDNVKTSKDDQTNGDQRKQPSESNGTASEKDTEREIKLKKRKKKINSADNHLGGSAGEEDRGGKEKLDKTVNGVEGSKKPKKRKKAADATDSSENSKSKGRRVSFSDDVEVFPLPEYLKYRKLNSEGDTIQGKRYTQEEDAMILQAVDDYIIEHGMAGDGVDRDLDEGWKRARSLIMNCKKNPELKGCWKEISRALPRRTIRSTYERAHVLYERAESRKWSKEELGTIRKFCEEHGPKWRLLGDILGKSRKHVKDAYRRVKMATLKKGAWSQEEYEQLFKLVNNDIIMRAEEEKKFKHGMLRDNIAWGAISDKLQTRASPSCCDKWYYQICSSMVLEGKWASTDDYRLVEALYTQDACCVEDVEWDALLEHRSGDLCHQRWKEMAKNLGEYRSKPFLEQVQILHERFDPDLIEPIETYQNKVPVDV